MSNIFKQNSRFGSLAEEVSSIKDSKKNNNKKENKSNEDKIKLEEDKTNISANNFKSENNMFKSENNTFKKTYDDNKFQRNYNNSYQRNSLTNRESKESIERRLLEEKLRKEEEEKIEQERIAESLCIDNFPTLGKKDDNKNIENNNNTSFLAKLTTSIEEDKNQAEVKKEVIKPGWVSISRDPLTGRSKFEYGQPIYTKPEKSEREMAYDVLNALCELHERRTAEYIELYGYDTWEKTFKSPNWEEERDYYERLDEEYEAEMAKEEEDEDDYDEEYTTESDKYNRYWEHY